MNEKHARRSSSSACTDIDAGEAAGLSGMPHAALIVVDVQAGFDGAHWGPRNNSEADTNIADLVGAFTASGNPVVLVRHDSEEDGSPLRRGEPGNQFKTYLRTIEPDLVVAKHVESAFHGSPDLDEWLMAHGITDLVIVGITTNQCCETTARVGADLGYRVHFVLDATHTFDRIGPDGRLWSADVLSSLTAANLHGELVDIISTADIVGSCASAGPG